MMPRRAVAAAFALLAFVSVEPALAQRAQGPDSDWTFENHDPAWGTGKGPLIAFSRQLSDFVANGSHEPLARLARSDGFQTEDIDNVAPNAAKILVLINNHRPDWRDFPAMDPPSAFSDAEIASIRKWVEDGGGLLILADHAPLGGGASKLAAAFGFTFLNGHVAEAKSADAGYAHVILDFRPGAGLNTAHAITDGSTGRPKIDNFQAFGGQAFIPADDATTLLTIPQGWSAFLTYDLQRNLTSVPRIDASGMAQGAAMEYHKGRIAVFGEAAAFSAQLMPGEEAVGFNTPEGRDNPEFVLALLRWLAQYQPAQ